MPEPTNPVLIHHLAPKNFLSFGPDNAGIDLKALNLFIGPNGCGKSNLIEAVSLMRSAPKEMRDVTRKGGGVAEWIWKGDPREPASVEWTVRNSQGSMLLRHYVAFRSVGQSFSLVDERIEDSELKLADASDVDFYYRYQQGRPLLNTIDRRKVKVLLTEADRSILVQRRDPEAYPELAWWLKITKGCEFIENGHSGRMRCSVNPRRRTCGMTPWKRISPILASS